MCQLVSDLLNIVGRGEGGCQGEFQLRCATLSFDRCRGLLQSTQKPQNIVSLWETLSVNEEHYWGRYWTLFVRFYSGILHMNRQNPINMPAAKLDWLKCKLGSIELFNFNYTGFNTKIIGSKAFEQQIFHFGIPASNNEQLCGGKAFGQMCLTLVQEQQGNSERASEIFLFNRSINGFDANELFNYLLSTNRSSSMQHSLDFIIRCSILIT